MSSKNISNKQDNDNRNSLLNLSDEQLKERLCHDCYNDYTLDSSTLSKYQGGGEFLRFTWRLRKNIQRHFPGCPSRLISSILSKCWKYMPITRHLLRSSDPRLCCHCGQLKRVITSSLNDDNDKYSILSKFQRYDNLKICDGEMLEAGLPEELEWLLITGKYLQSNSNYASSKCKGRNNLLKVASKRAYDSQLPDLIKYCDIDQSCLSVPDFLNNKKFSNKISNTYPNLESSGINLGIQGFHTGNSYPLSTDTIDSPGNEPNQAYFNEPFSEKNIMLCILNNVSTTDPNIPDDSCLNNKSDSRF